MEPEIHASCHRGGTSRSSSSRHLRLFGWESISNFFDVTPLEVHKEILQLEAKEFGDKDYLSDKNIGGSSLKWILDLGKFHSRRIHFLHSIIHFCQMETLLSMVISNKQVENYTLFSGKEDIKRILRDMKYNMDDIVVLLSNIEHYIISNSDTQSDEHQEGPGVVIIPAQESPQANSTTSSLVIILE